MMLAVIAVSMTAGPALGWGSVCASVCVPPNDVCGGRLVPRWPESTSRSETNGTRGLSRRTDLSEGVLEIF